jgi:hypothetical protein
MWKNKLFVSVFIALILGVLSAVLAALLLPPSLHKISVESSVDTGNKSNSSVGESASPGDTGEPLWGSTKPENTPKPSLDPDEVMDRAAERALSKLPRGDLYHSVPLKMKVQKQSIIEAGIAPRMSQKILDELQKRPYSQIKQGIKYSPSGVEMKLITRKDDFDVLALHMQDKQRILKESPGKWKWLVTPLNSGKRLVTIQAIVYVKNPANKEKESFPYEVFSQEIAIESDPAYSFTQFFATNWDKVIGLIIGSGSLASGVTWWLGQRKKKVEPPAEPQEKEAVAGRK